MSGAQMPAGPVLVTGAAGFIGGHLVAALVREGRAVRALCRYTSRDDRGTLELLEPEVRREVEVLLGDLRDPESVARAAHGSGTVFHLGAQIAVPYSLINPRDFFETNVLGTLNVAEAARAAAVERVVHVSTSEVYGSARAVPMTEEHPQNPSSPYAASKAGGDKVMESFHRAYDLPVAIVRPFNTYGPRQSPRAVLPTIVAQALAGGPVRLGSLAPRRDLLYVEDTVAGLLAAAQAPGAVGRTVQLGTGREVAVGELVALVGELLDRELAVEEDAARVRPAASEVTRLVADAGLARELLGWAPQVDLREGLRRTIDWIAGHPPRAVEEYAL